MLRTIFLPLVLWALSAAATAQDADLSAFVQAQHAIRAQVQAGTGDYAGMPDAKRRQLLQLQDRLFAIAGDHQLEQLDRDAQVAALNAVSAIRALTTAEERRVCRRESRVGSHRIRTTCRTGSQLRREEDAARENMRRARSNCPTATSETRGSFACS